MNEALTGKGDKGRLGGGVCLVPCDVNESRHGATQVGRAARWSEPHRGAEVFWAKRGGVAGAAQLGAVFAVVGVLKGGAQAIAFDAFS